MRTIDFRFSFRGRMVWGTGLLGILMCSGVAGFRAVHAQGDKSDTPKIEIPDTSNFEGEYRDFEVMLIETSTEEAQFAGDFTGVIDGSVAWELILQSFEEKDSPSTLLACVMLFPGTPEESARSRIGIRRGNEEADELLEARVSLVPTEEDDLVDADIAVGFSKRYLTTMTKLRPRIPQLLGVIETKDPDTNIVVFGTLRTY